MAAVQNVDGYNVPDGGLGSFLSSNLDKIDDNVLMFGDARGINSMQDVAQKMADMGRSTDSYIVHATEKEIIVPKEVGDKNPELILQIKDAIARDGMDPEAYVVGSEANSINPKTGQPEFFKFLKKLVKGLKKAAKVILPIAINYFVPGLGTIASSAIGAGIGGLIQGEKPGEALKSAVKGAVIAGVASGVAGAAKSFANDQTLMEGFKTGVQSGLPASYDGGINILPSASDFALRDATSPGLFEPFSTGYAQNEQFQQIIKEQQSAPLAVRQAIEDQKKIAEIQATAKAKGVDLTSSQAADVLAKSGSAAGGGSIAKTLAASILPTLAVGAATGAFDEIPAEQIDLTQTLGPVGEDIIQETYKDPTQMVQANPELYRVGAARRAPMVTVEDVLVPSRFSRNLYSPPVRAAKGGAMDFPRRNGQIEGPGTETSDDIPAMLSDGEFVMTAQAVRGAGNGNREQGFRRMYDIMRAFEGGAVT